MSRGPLASTPRQHLLDRIDQRPFAEGMTDCWVWRLAPGGRGYGIWKRHDQHFNTGAHRVSYMEFKGEIPEGFEVDHLCFNRLCVNPDHLEAVTASVNTRRASARRWADHDFTLIYRESQNLWVSRVHIEQGKGARRKEFYSRDRAVAIQKMRNYLNLDANV